MASHYTRGYTVCIFALGNLPCKFCWRFSASSTKSKIAAKILCHSLELELLHGFVSCLVQRNNPTLDVCWLAFCVIMIIKTYIFLFFRILADISVLLIFAKLSKFGDKLYCYTAQMWSFVYAQWFWEKLFLFFHFFNKILDGLRITCYSQDGHGQSAVPHGQGSQGQGAAPRGQGGHGRSGRLPPSRQLIIPPRI